MNFISFCDQIVSTVSELYPECTIKLSDVDKNNGLIYKGLTIIRPGDKIAEVIYLEPLYEAFLNGSSFKEIINRIEKARLESKEVNFNLEYFTNYEMVRDKIMFKLINYEKNKNFLMNIPHRRFMDLAIVYYCAIASKPSEGIVVVKNEHISLWNITEKDLYEVACANAITKNDPDVIPMKNVLAGGPGYLLTGSDYYSESESDYDPFPFLKILTNKDRTYGASVILNPGLLCALSHKYNSNFYIIPSSVHELILVIDDADHFDENKANDLYEMVKFVNITEVDPEDVLSDNLYYYNRTEDSLSDIKSYKELAMK